MVNLLSKLHRDFNAKAPAGLPPRPQFLELVLGEEVLEPPKEPVRPRAHWDHVLEEMVWLAKDFESERKWKLGQAKRVAIRASKSRLDQASRGEKRLKEEEQRLRRVAINISKDVKKFWMKIEKLVLYKHQLELEERKKKALDRQLDFLLGQTERYSTMLAENLIDLPCSYEQIPPHLLQSMPSETGNELSSHWKKNDIQLAQGSIDHGQYTASDPLSESMNEMHASVQETDSKVLHKESHFYNVENEDEFRLGSEDDDMEDDEATLEADEALITEEERREELAALQNEIDVPLEELLKRYKVNEGSEEENEEVCDEEDTRKCTQQDIPHIAKTTTGVESVVGKSLETDAICSPILGSVLQGTSQEVSNDQHEKEPQFPSADGSTSNSRDGDPAMTVSHEARCSEKISTDMEQTGGNPVVCLLTDLGEGTDDHLVPVGGKSVSRATVLDKGGGQDAEPLYGGPRSRVHSGRQRRAMKESVIASDSGNETNALMLAAWNILFKADDGEYILAAFTGEEKVLEILKPQHCLGVELFDATAEGHPAIKINLQHALYNTGQECAIELSAI
eukprot:Gb_04357 [translate_table: standard]